MPSWAFGFENPLNMMAFERPSEYIRIIVIGCLMLVYYVSVLSLFCCCLLPAGDA